MIYFFLSLISRLLRLKPVHAHCDIPCGIYDPHQMQLAAHTVIRMTQLIEELGKEPDAHKLARYTATKEEHGELCKKEIRILWGDYFKPEHVEQHPELHDTVWKALKAASKARQEVNMQASQELLSLTQEIAEIFWRTKGVETVRRKSYYPTEGEMVLPKA